MNSLLVIKFIITTFTHVKANPGLLKCVKYGVFEQIMVYEKLGGMYAQASCFMINDMV